MIKKNVFWLTAYSLLLIALTGCGYTTRSMVGDKYRKIYILPFENKIDITKEIDAANRYKVYRPMLETDITQAVINKFLFDRNLKPAKEDSADLVLKGELIEFRREPLRYTGDDQIEEYRLNIVVNLSLWDRNEDKLLWQENGFTGDTTHFVTGAAAKSEDLAINDAINDLARRIVERTVEKW